MKEIGEILSFIAFVSIIVIGVSYCDRHEAETTCIRMTKENITPYCAAYIENMKKAK